MIAAQKNHLDLVSIVESAGVELRRSGTRYVGLCPFHPEKTPSFYVFPDNCFKCFGCGEYGDSVDFVQKLHGVSFPEALKHLGIEQGHITPRVRMEIQQRKRKAELLKQFRKWELRYGGYVGGMIFDTEELMLNGIPPDDLELYAPLLDALPVWEHHLEILVHGTDGEKYKLFKGAQRCSYRNST